ncbi:MAG: hypothetical protein PF542_01235 [Nanoarchaeota archaeon]|jgi:hypothetical protein|nr:hypothetical protein [Nanoarchaeota archaeon]
MVNESIINYLREGLASGNAISLLRRTLIENGWPQDQVDDAIGEIQGENVARPGYSALGEKLGHKDVSMNREILNKKKRPVGVTIVASLHWVIALTWLLVFALPGVLFSALATSPFANMGMIVGLIIGVVLASFPSAVGIGIWKGNNGWRIVGIVFGCIFTLLSVFVIFTVGLSGIIGLAMSGFIAGYLLFSKEAKAYFNR